MYEKLCDIKKVYETNNVEELNALLDNYWILLDMYSRFHEVDYDEPLKEIIYVVGSTKGKF